MRFQESHDTIPYTYHHSYLSALITLDNLLSLWVGEHVVLQPVLPNHLFAAHLGMFTPFFLSILYTVGTGENEA